MSRATYPVTCECGTTLKVPGAAAGTTWACQCGRNVEIPTLARLKASAGKAAVSADFALAGLIQARALPLEPDCVLCGHATNYRAVYRVVCERPEVATPGMRGWEWALLAFLSPFRLLTTLIATRGESTVYGRDVTFVLPVRVCEFCVASLTTATAVRAAMCRTPVYADLFRKYPGSGITNAD